jgi:hypothetical protein
MVQSKYSERHKTEKEGGESNHEYDDDKSYKGVETIDEEHEGHDMGTYEDKDDGWIGQGDFDREGW